MSEKHLTELPWKVLATKHGLKDLGMQKALVAYGKLEALKLPGPALEALKEISEIAVKLKKAKPKEDVLDYLEEMIKEVKKTTPLLEGRVKSASAGAAAAEKAAETKTETTVKPAAQNDESEKEEEDEEEDEEQKKEAAELKKDLKKKMVSALAEVKMRAPGDPEQQKKPKPQLKFMTFVGGDNCSVIVARKVGGATMKKLLTEMAGVAGGGKFVSGECVFENNVHTFIVDKAPAGLRKKLEKALAAETGVKYKALVKGPDGTILEDLEPTDTTAGEDGAKFKARLAALAPEIKAKPQIKVAAGTKDEKALNVTAAEAAALANKQEYAGANKLLDLVESALKQGTAAAAPTAGKPAAKPAAAAETATARDIKLSTYLSGHANLRAARESSEKELQRMRKTILDLAADEPFQKEVEAKSQKLFEYLAPIDDSVLSKLEEAGRCTDSEKQDELNKKLRELIQKQLGALRSHALASFMENNPFGKFTVRQPLEVTLSALDKQLS